MENAECKRNLSLILCGTFCLSAGSSGEKFMGQLNSGSVSSELLNVSRSVKKSLSLDEDSLSDISGQLEAHDSDLDDDDEKNSVLGMLCWISVAFFFWQSHCARMKSISLFKSLFSA